MKTMIAALMLFTLVLTTTAQKPKAYYISPNYNTNLRAAPDIDSERVELVSPLHVLVVVGEEGDWLKINRLGTEVYMANWVSYRIVGSGAQVSTQYADVNCKGPRFVQDADYPFQGFWVFSKWGRSTCEVTTRSPISAFPAEAFVDNGREIEVEGSPELADQISMVIEIFKETAPEWQAFVANAIDKIIGYELDSEHDIFSADAYVQPRQRTLYVSRPAVFRATGPQEEQLMTVLVHEACHVYQVELGMKLDGDEFEVMCHALEMDLIDVLQLPWLKRLVRFHIVNYLYADNL